MMVRMAELRTRPRKTVEDFLRLPEDTRAELIDGEILMSPSPTPRHQSILWNLSTLMGVFLQSHRQGRAFCAPLDIHLPSGDVVQPDLIFVAARNLAIVKEERIVGAPDLLVETLSPSNPERDLIVKRRLYAANGVQEYWIVDDESKTVEVNVLAGSQYAPAGCFRPGETLVSPTLPGFQCQVQALFE